MINLIAAMANNRVIGYGNQLPWHLPADLQYFKKTTLNTTVIMGRKTFESIGKALPSRDNIVISKQKKFQAKDCKMASSLDEAIHVASHSDIFIIGGQSIYEQALSKADRLYITKIHTHVKGDAYFPQIDLNEWKEIKKETHKIDEKNQYDYDFLVYRACPRTKKPL